MLAKRRLGQSDLIVSALGLGCWQFSRGQGLGGKYWAFLPDAEIREIVRICLDGGINWFDTAESYGKGESERSLARALRSQKKSPGDVIIATKWQPLFRTAGSILETVDTRLANLDGFPIDLYQIHNPLSFSSIKAQMRGMARLVRDKKIRSIGVSNFSAQQMRKAHTELSAFGLRLATNQVRFSLLDRGIETNGVLDTAKELGVSIISYSPLAQGLLSGKFHENPGLIRKRSGYRKYMRAFKPRGLEKSRPVIQALRELAQKYQVTPAQIALNWLVNFHGEIVVAIPGATSAAQAQENIGTLTFSLNREELGHLDKVSSRFKEN